MKHQPPVPVLFLVLLLFSLPVKAQVSFFQPPAYVGMGNPFIADFTQDGKLDLLTSDGFVNIGNGDGTFSAGTTVKGFGVLAVADFNGDGKPDVLEQGTGTLLVLLGKGDGTFQAAISTASGASLMAAAAIDLNGDRKADVVGVFNSTLFVYLGNGDGTFAPAVTYNLGAMSTLCCGTSLSLGDFNGDGKTDVVVTIGTPGGEEIVLLGNGDATFQAAHTTASVDNPAYPVVGDFNGDGKLDLAIAGRDPSSNYYIYVLRGKGDGTFDAPTIAFPGLGPLGAGDLNGDGKLDLILQSDPTVGQIYLGNGDGTFSNSGNYLLNFPGSPQISQSAVAIADFNGDGKKDFAIGNAVLMGNGDGTFHGIQFCLLPDISVSPGAQAGGDFDKNGTQDVALISNQHIYILNNSGGGVLSLTHTYSVPQPGFAIVSADFNGDGNLDLVVFETDSSGDWGYSVLLGNGDGTFQSPIYHPQNVQTGAQSYSVIVADFNNDHKLDIATSLAGNSGNQTLAVLLGNGDGTFAAPSYFFDATASFLLSGDFNGDGNLDIAAGGYSGSVLSAPQTAILFGKGDGTFQAAVFPVSLNNFEAQFVADLNKDGKPDLISFGSAGAGSQVALGNGDGTFTVLPSLTSEVNAIADFNGDGVPDILVTSFYRGFRDQTGVMLGNGNGTFGSMNRVPSSGLLPSTVLAVDMNGDGHPDIVFPWSNYLFGVGVLLNTTVATAPGFAVSPASGSSISQTVSAGQGAKFDLVVASTGTFSGTVNLSCSITPPVTPAPTCSLSTSSVQVAAGVGKPVTVNVATTATVTTGAYPFAFSPPGVLPLVWTVMLLSSAFLWLRSRKPLLSLLAPMTVFVLASLVSCGGSSSPSHHTTPGTPSGTYTVTITASSGAVSHNMPLTVVVN
jgi:hypothetical protein